MYTKFHLQQHRSLKVNVVGDNLFVVLFWIIREKTQSTSTTEQLNASWKI